ncbi:hypothetical protein NL466_29065, partial [Klebsiella pneumoniae]|nr:hypothetical protein [Klebsiella pneumoniae]
MVEAKRDCAAPQAAQPRPFCFSTAPQLAQIAISTGMLTSLAEHYLPHLLSTSIMLSSPQIAKKFAGD